jgi:hypothetical protein
VTDRTCDQCGKHLISQRRGARFCGDECKNAWHNKARLRQGTTDKRLARPQSGAGSRGGDVRSVQEARSLHAEHKPEWSQKVRAHIALTLIETGAFHADDLQPLQIPEAHSAVIGSQIASYVNRKLMRKVGERKCIHKAANGRKAAIYEITDLGRKTLAGVGAGSVCPSGTSADSGESAGCSDDTEGSATGARPSILDRPAGSSFPADDAVSDSDDRSEGPSTPPSEPPQLPGVEPSPYERLRDAA